MSGYALTNAQLRTLKCKLTKAVKSDNLQTIRQVVADATRVFEELGYPDCWMNWSRALDDAETKAVYR